MTQQEFKVHLTLLGFVANRSYAYRNSDLSVIFSSMDDIMTSVRVANNIGHVHFGDYSSALEYIAKELESE